MKKKSFVELVNETLINMYKCKIQNIIKTEKKYLNIYSKNDLKLCLESLITNDNISYLEKIQLNEILQEVNSLY